MLLVHLPQCYCVDSVGIYYSSWSMVTTENQLQLATNPLLHWSLQNRHSFFTVKTQCVFHPITGFTLHHPNFYLKNSVLPFPPAINFTGNFLDSKLTYISCDESVVRVKGHSILWQVLGQGSDSNTSQGPHLIGFMYGSVMKSKLSITDPVHSIRFVLSLVPPVTACLWNLENCIH